MEQVQRVIYRRSSLVEVIFQLRFATLLFITKEKPVDLQEKLKEEYPIYREGKNASYSFISRNGLSKVELTPSYISLSTLSYKRWEDFESALRSVVEAFVATYMPSLIMRIGLRYVNVIKRKKLELGDTKWTEIINSHVLGVVNKSNVDNLKVLNTIVEYANSDGTFTRPHFELINITGETEPSFLIDCDYFKVGPSQVGEINDIAERLHEQSKSFIQSVIKKKLHLAMQPEYI